MAEKNKGIAFVEHGSSDDDSDHTGLSSSLVKLSLSCSEKKDKKLLVLCLGGLLVHRIHVSEIPMTPKSPPPDAAYRAYRVYKRPFCEEFLRFCLDNFEVGIWSSAMKWNVDTVLDIVMKSMKGELLFVMDQSSCTDSHCHSLEKRDKPLLFKDLSKVFKKVNHGVGKNQFSFANTLLIDKPHKALLNPDNTCIFPPMYDLNSEDDNLLDPKGAFCSYLLGLKSASDVRDYVKDHPFGLPKIDSSHPDWPFYSKVVHRVKLSNNWSS